MEQYLSDCLINPSEETLDYVDSFFEEHGHTSELQRWVEENDFGLKSDWI